jgi:DNA-binding NarL/FixJ family response regulator
MVTRILLVDDHPMFRSGLRSLLQSRCPETELTEAGDGAAAIKCAEALKSDLIILDIHLPDQNGIEVARQLLARMPATKIIILSAEANLAYVSQALQAGVSGYLLKMSVLEELLRAMSAVLAGTIYLCPEANAVVLEDYRQVLMARSAAKPLVSAREMEVLRFIADGLRVKEIAVRLEVGVKTVETYRRRLMKKLACDGTVDLVRYAMRNGIIQP